MVKLDRTITLNQREADIIIEVLTDQKDFLENEEDGIENPIFKEQVDTFNSIIDKVTQVD